MASTKDLTIKRVTDDYLDSIDINNPPAPEQVAYDIIALERNEFDLYNSAAMKNAKWKIQDRLLPVQIAEIMVRLHNIVRIESFPRCESEYTLLGIYQYDGEDEGTYVTSEDAFYEIAKKYCYGLSKHEKEELLSNIREVAPRVQPCREPNLIAVNNGIFNYDTKQLMPFTPDLVFMSKSRVDYNHAAQNIVIHNPIDGTDWDIDSWMDALSDDPEVVQVLWQVLGAIIRPNVHWGLSAWFFSESGNNGKGTLCELMRQLCGEGTYASISLSEFCKDFALEPLTHASAIIVDENDVGTYIDKAANLKAVVTGDVIQINRKFKQAISYKFKGFMVQCLNEMPRIKDKSDSFYRRQLFIPFTKCFTGAERKYIKYDYLHRKEVLEYVLFKVLNMNYYELSVPESCKDALQEYKEFNDPVRQFMADIMSELQWDLVPFTFLYDLYKAWYKKNIGQDKSALKSKQVFTKDVLRVLPEYPDWACPDRLKRYKPADKMSKPEWLIDEYKLEDWYSQTYKGPDKDKKCCPSLKATYTGIIRL